MEQPNAKPKSVKPFASRLEFISKLWSKLMRDGTGKEAEGKLEVTSAQTDAMPSL